MVNLVETNMIREFKGLVVDIKREEGSDKFPPQYVLQIKALEKPEWGLMKAWITIPKTATNTDVPKKSLLGVYMNRLQNWGIVADTHQETIHKMLDKTFLWKDEAPKIDGEIITKKEKLVPQTLLK